MRWTLWLLIINSPWLAGCGSVKLAPPPVPSEYCINLMIPGTPGPVPQPGFDCRLSTGKHVLKKFSEMEPGVWFPSSYEAIRRDWEAAACR